MNIHVMSHGVMQKVFENMCHSTTYTLVHRRVNAHTLTDGTGCTKGKEARKNIVFL